MKCAICQETLGETFLEKVKGTIIRKPGASKPYTICNNCQKKFKSKEEMLNGIK
ncbi:hypothetical protein HYU21_02070 [Candidatus Woesearchaeota archaeon]|nr:hypothetical protein [Candidatus Woesearchaeota archaeon]